MKNLLSPLLQRYQQLMGRLGRRVNDGSFTRYSRHKQQQLLARLARYERQLARYGVAVASASTLFLAPVQAQFMPLGNELRVNTTTLNNQSSAAIASDDAGNYVVVWQSNDGSDYGIYARRYNAAGTAQGNEFRVNTTTTNFQGNPSIAMDSDGDFVVVWGSSSGGFFDSYAQRYNAAGTAQGNEFRINTHTTGNQLSPSIAMDSDGDFVVAWYSNENSSYDIIAQRYNAAGTAQGGEFLVNTYTTGDQYLPSVAMDNDGDFVITWTRNNNGSNDIYAQRYNAAGVALGGEFQINTNPANLSSPNIALDNDGDFVVVWHASDGSDYGTYARCYHAGGIAQGGEFRVNTTTTNFQGNPSIAMSGEGNFVVTWDSEQQDGSSLGIYARRYNATGTAIGDEFLVNTYTINSQRIPRIAMESNGDFVVAWQSMQDGSGYGIYTQRYQFGAETRVNTYTTSSQFEPAIASDNAGNYVVVWQSYEQDGSNNGIYGQRYNAAGTAQGGEFLVNTYTTNFQANPAIAMDSDGDFVVVWQSNGQDGSGHGIYARRYNAAGTAQGNDFQVNTYITGNQLYPSIAMDSDGDFVIAWQNNDGNSYGIAARRYNAAGTAQGGEFQVNTYITDSQVAPSTAMDSDGDFAVAWRSNGQDGSGFGIFTRRYNAAGTAQGGEFQVNTHFTSDQSYPSIAMDSVGGFVVAWHSSFQDGSFSSTWARRYNAAGVAQSGEFRINTYTTSDQNYPSIAMANNGDFVVAWQSGSALSLTQDGSNWGVYAQRYNAAGVAQGGELPINSYTTSNQRNPCIAMDHDGDFVVAWQSEGQDGSNWGIYAQRYTETGVPQYRLAPTTAAPTQEQEQDDRITLSPNPTQGTLLVKLSEGLQGEVLHLFDLQGREILRHSSEAGLDHCQLDLSNLMPGVYVLRAGERSVKVIKE